MHVWQFFFVKVPKILIFFDIFLFTDTLTIDAKHSWHMFMRAMSEMYGFIQIQIAKKKFNNNKKRI